MFSASLQDNEVTILYAALAAISTREFRCYNSGGGCYVAEIDTALGTIWLDEESASLETDDTDYPLSDALAGELLSELHRHAHSIGADCSLGDVIQTLSDW